MVFVVFSAWVLVTAVMLVKAIKQQALDPADPAEDPAVAARLDELTADLAQLKSGTFTGR
jgi:hypothetical protein